MMIDEAIVDCKENDLWQIAEWLEELKKLRQCTNIENREYPYFNGFKEGKQVGYNKAIDDFKKEIIDMVNNSPTVENDYGEMRPMNIEEICEIIVDKLTSKQGDEKNND